MTLKKEKIEFAKNSLEGIFDDNRLVNEILFQYFYNWYLIHIDIIFFHIPPLINKLSCNV